MEKLISSVRYTSDHLCRPFLENLEERQEELNLRDAVFYYDFPSFRDYEDDSYRPNVMLLSPRHGVLALNLCELPNIHDRKPLTRADADLSQFFSILFGRLIKSRLLRKSRSELAIPFHSVIYAPSVAGLSLDAREVLENEFVGSLDSFTRWLTQHEIETVDDELLNEARSIIEGAKAFTKPKPRDVTAGTHHKANVLSALEAEISNFDIEQRKAAITMLAGPQRIRGLAGTGKTIVLAMKAAQIHLNEPSKRILYTFYTKSLYDLIKRLITRFFRHYKDSDPDWTRLKILHAWGGAGIEGVYHAACIAHGVPAIRFRDIGPAVAEPFDYICTELLKAPINAAYDYTLIDEGQDLPQSFFRLCYYLTAGSKDEKNIVWAYDELQNIFNVKVRTPTELFGSDNDGSPLVDLERAATKLPAYLSNDLLLRKSYRNPKEILIAAHALGFGLYSHQIVQMLENREHWEDVGYSVEQGAFTPGSPTVILRPDENSPLSVAKWEKKENIIQVFQADAVASEIQWICAQIRDFINDGLHPEDILVVSLDDRNARSYFSSIRDSLLQSSITCNNILDNPYTSSRFAIEGRVTLSTVHRAKGNEAAAVLAIGINAIHPMRNSLTGRNRIFTAFTRAKVWLRISGVGQHSALFLKEVGVSLEHSPRLDFPFPDLKQVSLLQRDVGKRELKLRNLRDRYRRELERLGLDQDDMAEFFTNQEDK